MPESVECWSTLAQTAMPLWAYKIPGLVFAFCFGACVGSFLNVVVYRLPAGISIIAPPSRCPTCGARLTWRENLPVLGWIMLRGKCRYCGARISAQYMIVELFMALLFLGLAIIFYLVRPPSPWEGTIFGPWWFYNGVTTLPAFIAILVLFSGLVAMTLIDARTFTIPLQIPLFVSIVAVAMYALQGAFEVLNWATSKGEQAWPIPEIGAAWLWVTAGGIIGLAVSLALLRVGVFRYSFHDYEEYLEEDEPLADYPHARREMLIEILFLLPAAVLVIAGYFLGRAVSGDGPAPEFLGAVGSSLFGYLFAGAFVWGLRIFFSLVFGKEALGMGDVHLMAAVGAVLGWRDPMFIFFGGAVVGLAWVVLTLVLRPFFKRIQRELPFGPHLAVATLLVVIAHPMIYPEWWDVIVHAWQVFSPTFP